MRIYDSAIIVPYLYNDLVFVFGPFFFSRFFLFMKQPVDIRRLPVPLDSIDINRK